MFNQNSLERRNLYQSSPERKLITLTDEIISNVDEFSEMILNDLNRFVKKQIFVGLDKDGKLTNIEVLKKTEHTHIYLCSYEGVHSFFALLIFENEDSKDCWLEFEHASRCADLKDWVRKRLKENSESLKFEKAA